MESLAIELEDFVGRLGSEGDRRVEIPLERYLGGELLMFVRLGGRLKRKGLVSGRIEVESNLKTLLSQGFNGSSAHRCIPPGFKKPEGEVFGRAEPGRKRFVEDAALIEQLCEDVSDLQQEIEDLG